MGFNSAFKGLMKFQFTWQSFEQNLNTKFHENSPMGAEMFHGDRRTGGRDEANSRFSLFCEGY